MPEYDNKGTWVLFRNKRKKLETHPEYTGTLTLLDGTECWLDAWVKTDKNGDTFFSGRYKPKESQEPQQGYGEEPQGRKWSPF